MDNTIYILIALLFVHYIADFVCQNDKMALNKSKSLYWLSVHVLIYICVFAFFFAFIFVPPVGFGIDPQKGIIFIFVNGGAHWITDFFTSKLNTYLLNKYKSKHWFFVSVGFNQFLHTATILFTYQLFII